MTDLFLVLVLVLIIAIVARGPKTLPMIGRAFGQGVKEARREVGELRSKTDEDADKADRPDA